AFFRNDSPTWWGKPVVVKRRDEVAGAVRHLDVKNVRDTYVPVIHQLNKKRYLVGVKLINGDAKQAWEEHRATLDEFAKPGKAQQKKRQTKGEKPGRGLWGNATRSELTKEQREQIEALEAIGYIDGEMLAEGVLPVISDHDATRAQQGLNFYTSGHAPEATLMTMNGQVLHRWKARFRDVFGQAINTKRDHKGAQYWRRAWPLENGDVIAIFEGLAIIRIDKDSQVVWAVQNNAHHDAAFLPDSSLIVLTRTAHLVPEVNPDIPALEDFVVWMDENGEETRRLSLLKALLESEHRSIFDRVQRKWKKAGDLFHTNAIEILDGSLEHRDPAFKAGNLLLSSRAMSALYIVDPEAEKVVWSARGEFRTQHDPHVTFDGTILLFDNTGRNGKSQLLEIDPISHDPTWRWPKQRQNPFFSGICGTVARLDNGNTLATESRGGRAVELAPNGEAVWNFQSPHRAGDNDAYIAMLFEMIRLPPDFPFRGDDEESGTE
ncbi:MAG: hypothetical protein HN348_10410, partial [Proteobacteria bacterium]|nr:hypothetical protein [Pseudomonadota bacterium]